MLALALGLVLLLRTIEWFAGGHDAARRAAAPAPAAPVPSPRPSAVPGAVLLLDQRGVALVGYGAAFSVAPGLYATSEALTDPSERVQVQLPFATAFGKVIARDRARGGVALFTTDGQPPLASLTLAGAASLRRGRRLRVLVAVPGGPRTSAYAVETLFERSFVEDGIVQLKAEISGTPIEGTPVYDEDARAAGIVVRRRNSEKTLLIAADYVRELAARVPQSPR